jgi:hypothetical protein
MEFENNIILAIQRAECYSPNSVEKDYSILHAVGERLEARGWTVEYVAEESLAGETLPMAKAYLSMARSPKALEMLKRAEAEGRLVMNSTQGVESCTRSRVEKVLQRLSTPMVPPRQGENGYWLKRGDVAGSIDDADVCYAADRQQLEQLKADFCRRGISDYTVSSHVRGREVKFYGVGTRFFRCYDAKGGADVSVDGLPTAAVALSSTVGVSVFGGDCIVRPDGTFCIIDFNDWPSFARCREEAADAIAALVKEMKSK